MPPGQQPFTAAPLPASTPERLMVGEPQGLNPFGQTMGKPEMSPFVAGRDPELVPHDAPRWLAGFLVYSVGDGAFWQLRQGPNRIGRLDAAPGLDISIDDPTTSSEHAIILAAARPGRLKLEDIGSTNGTYLNGTRLVPGAKHELSDGDSLQFGGFEVTVKII